MIGAFWRRLVRGVWRDWQRPDWATFAGNDWARTIMQVAVTDRYSAKQGRSTGRWILSADGRRLGVYLKRHYRLPWWSGLLAVLWPGGRWSPASQEFRNLAWAQEQGLPVPAPVAVGETIGPWCKLQSVLAVQELDCMLDLHQAMPLAAATLDAAAFRAWKRGLAEELARLTRALHERDRYHKDLYLCHFFIAPEDLRKSPACWRGRVHIIDFHRLGHHPWTGPIWRVKDLAQLLYSTFIPGIDVRDRLQFWRSYLGKHRTHGWLARLVRWKGERYRRHNQRSTSRG